MYSHLGVGLIAEAGRGPARPLPRILVADDEAVVLKVTALILRRANFAVTPVASGEEALAIMETESFDLIVTDFKMGGKSGAEVALAARQICPETPVMLMTGLIDDVPEWIRRGELALPIVRKPFQMTELLHAVNRVIPAVMAAPSGSL